MKRYEDSLSDVQARDWESAARTPRMSGQAARQFSYGFRPWPGVSNSIAKLRAFFRGRLY
jgi:hypothetical protein